MTKLAENNPQGTANITDNRWKLISGELPEKGLDCEVMTKEGVIHQAFRCGCHSDYCQDWRCPITGYSLMIYDVVAWRYLNNR